MPNDTKPTPKPVRDLKPGSGSSVDRLLGAMLPEDGGDATNPRPTNPAATPRDERR